MATNQPRLCPRCKQPTDAKPNQSYTWRCRACNRARRTPEAERAQWERRYAATKEEFLLRLRLRVQSDPEYRQRYLARRLANAAIQQGKLQRQPCEDCGAANAEKHHEDYSQPLVVRWKCRRCHAKLHRLP